MQVVPSAGGVAMMNLWFFFFISFLCVCVCFVKVNFIVYFFLCHSSFVHDVSGVELNLIALTHTFKCWLMLDGRKKRILGKSHWFVCHKHTHRISINNFTFFCINYRFISCCLWIQTPVEIKIKFPQHFYIYFVYAVSGYVKVW